MAGSEITTLLIIVTAIGFVLGLIYGKFTTNSKWHSDISSVKWKAIPKNMTDAVMTQNLSGYSDEAVYVLSVPAISELFSTQPMVPAQVDLPVESIIDRVRHHIDIPSEEQPGQ